MSNIISNRSEILFLYETENANPNGDPLNENRPRFDSEDSTALVSDVRLKRTIRDYLFNYKGYNGKEDKDIFVRETTYEEGDKTYISDGKRRAKDFGEDRDRVIANCIDIRLFGGVIPLKRASITLVGPVQFQMGRSLNQVDIVTEQGTGAFASGDKKSQATFRTEYKIPYGLIGFNGIINEKAAQYSKMTEADKQLLLEGIWEGTKNLISRSKFGQNPLLLLVVNYRDSFYTGHLRQRVKLTSDKSGLAIRSTNDYSLDLTDLWGTLKQNADKIASIEVKFDNRLNFTNKEKVANGRLDPNEL
ncbi:type I-B CRISPR-associated protein Cas7/Csh2 [Marinilongibacter aquaticus]|uniref:type I-B CRISPR-associated protein Cas7/Csh2 n=1 Tax=Marinilongibacter aquaticus TaxID=2975157 RepID=UPI0021BDD288|nr:type I-B CRISPR-associated protein Cas7/Csh2 [Marinilongibacter aquaticus]UBM60787.1 type I-B CRISPR-associated protein Cas7/Csh2 [Marinilongibacter aquaticus]